MPREESHRCIRARLYRLYQRGECASSPDRRRTRWWKSRFLQNRDTVVIRAAEAGHSERGIDVKNISLLTYDCLYLHINEYSLFNNFEEVVLHMQKEAYQSEKRSLTYRNLKDAVTRLILSQTLTNIRSGFHEKPPKQTHFCTFRLYGQFSLSGELLTWECNRLKRSFLSLTLIQLIVIEQLTHSDVSLFLHWNVELVIKMS